MSCASPIPFETLVELWAGECADAERIEDHLFTCDFCAASSEQLDRLLGSLLYQVPPVVTRRLRDQLEKRGFKILELAFDAGSRAEAHFAADLDLLVFAFHADFTGVRRVDMDVGDDTGATYFAFSHIPFDPERGEVLVACQQHFRHYQTAHTPEFRLYAVDGETRRPIGSYVIDHIWPPL